MKIEKYYLNLAGEYRICAELLKRHIFATVTYGNMKGADIFAIGPNRRAAVVEVKASNSSRFVTKFYQRYKSRDVEHPNFWVLYSVTPRDRFFVLSHAQLADVQAERNHPGEDLSYDERAKRVEHGVDNVLIRDVEAHEDAGPKSSTGARLRSSNLPIQQHGISPLPDFSQPPFSKGTRLWNLFSVRSYSCRTTSHPQGWALCNGQLLPEYPLEDFIHIPQWPLQIECAFQRLAFHLQRDLRIAHDQLAKIQVFLPRLHGI